MTSYDIDVQRETIDDEDVELAEFSDEIEAWVIKEFQRVHWIQLKVFWTKVLPI